MAFNVIPAFLISEPRSLAADASSECPGNEADGESGKTRVGRLLHISVAHAFTWLGVQTMFVYLFAYVKHAMELPGGDDAAVGRVINVAFLILNTVGFLLPVLVLQPLCRSLGTVRTHAICIAVMAAGYAGILLMGRAPWGLYLGMAIVGVGWAATVSLPFAILSRTVSRGRMGFFMGLFNLAVVIPQLVSSGLLGQWIAAAPDKSLVFGIATGSLALSALLWFLVAPESSEEVPASPVPTNSHG